MRDAATGGSHDLQPSLEELIDYRPLLPGEVISIETIVISKPNVEVSELNLIAMKCACSDVSAEVKASIQGLAENRPWIRGFSDPLGPVAVAAVTAGKPFLSGIIKISGAKGI